MEEIASKLFGFMKDKVVQKVQEKVQEKVEEKIKETIKEKIQEKVGDMITNAGDMVGNIGDLAENIKNGDIGGAFQEMKDIHSGFKEIKEGVEDFKGEEEDPKGKTQEVKGYSPVLQTESDMVSQTMPTQRGSSSPNPIRQKRMPIGEFKGAKYEAHCGLFKLCFCFEGVPIVGNLFYQETQAYKDHKQRVYDSMQKRALCCCASGCQACPLSFLCYSTS